MLNPFQRTPRTAAEWVARMRSDRVTLDDHAALAAWLEASPQNRADYDAAAATWSLASRLGASPVARAYLAEAAAAPRPAALRQPLRLAGAAAGVAAIAATLLVAWLGRDTYSTGVGQTSVVSLDDGSTAWLNTNTRLAVRFGERTRTIVLERGEAFFSVAHDAAKPFVVEAGTHRIVVTGTQFDVRHDPASVEVAVLEGHVRVDRGAGTGEGRAGRAAEPAETFSLSAGEEARIDAVVAAVDTAARDDRRVGVTPAVIERNRAVDKKTAWRDGQIHLDNARLGAALEEINRYTKTKLVLADPRASGLSISGVFRTGDIDSVLFALHELYRLQVRRESGRIVLHRHAS